MRSGWVLSEFRDALSALWDTLSVEENNIPVLTNQDCLKNKNQIRTSLKRLSKDQCNHGKCGQASLCQPLFVHVPLSECFQRDKITNTNFPRWKHWLTLCQSNFIPKNQERKAKCPILVNVTIALKVPCQVQQVFFIACRRFGFEKGLKREQHTDEHTDRKPVSNAQQIDF